MLVRSRRNGTTRPPSTDAASSRARFVRAAATSVASALLPSFVTETPALYSTPAVSFSPAPTGERIVATGFARSNEK